MTEQENQNMTLKPLGRTGWLLVVAGLAGGGITFAKMVAIYSGGGIASHPALAEAISATLIFATIGSLLVLAGIVMVLLGWWRKRRGSKRQRFQSAM